MHNMNIFLATVPFDLYELNLFQLVAETRSFTQAGQRAGLTQSAITRQIQGMESRLGVTLFERTTRQACLTLAGRALHAKAGAILQAANEAISQLQQQFQLAPQILRVGVARSIGVGYLPGFFFAYQKKFPKVQLNVVQQTSREILEAVEKNELDAGLLCPPPRLSRSLRTTHQFKDEFVLIAPPKFALPADAKTQSLAQLKKILATEKWLLINRETNTGIRLRHWLEGQNWKIEPTMEMDSFDVIVNLVSLGLGVSIVPRRVLPIYENRRLVTRLPATRQFVRELVMVVRKNRNPPAHLTGFVENILF
jgi:DNA-binding transcriptional LysR family regulator